MSAASELGRREGRWIPAAEVEAHLACGWRMVDDAAGQTPVDDCVLMAAPPSCGALAPDAARPLARAFNLNACLLGPDGWPANFGEGECA